VHFHTHATWLSGRTSGVLLHISSLPGPHGIGKLGSSARRFIDFLASAGCRYWQICPVGPTGYGDSPYQSFSSFAGNPYFIDPDPLIEAGYLKPAALDFLEGVDPQFVDYGLLYERMWDVLADVYAAYLAEPGRLNAVESFEAFRSRHSDWVEAFGLFMALKKAHGGIAWQEWERPYRDGPGAFKQVPAELRAYAEQHIFYQYLFDIQWQQLRAYAGRQNIQIIGDLPIFVAMDSADTWQDRSAFRIDGDGRPECVSGVPPDYFSEKGQLWGNPLYDWDALKLDGYRWWLRRLERIFTLYDVIRLDHFRAFDSYWEVPADAEDACSGNWRSGPGLHFFHTLRRQLPMARIIAEDLGYITEGVVRLRQQAGLPGMKILQFSYGHDDNNVNLPHFFHQDTVVYTGTHDNDTTRGWLEGLTGATRQQIMNYYRPGPQVGAAPFIEAAMASVARMAILPVQDLLNLGSEARFNVPGFGYGNWRWRLTESQFGELSTTSAETLSRLNNLYDRTGDQVQREYSAPPAVTPSVAKSQHTQTYAETTRA
jgi:4-alpha-glucanotransferase